MKTRNDCSAFMRGRLLVFLALLALAGCSSPLSDIKTITPIYAATSGGLSVYTGSGWTTYKASTSTIPGNSVSDVVVSGSGATAYIYAATDGGIWVYNPSTGKETVYSKTDLGIGTAAINGLFLGTRLYVATGAGLAEISSSGIVLVTTSDGLASNSVNGVYEDTSGNIYAATGSGLSICTGGKWRTYSISLPTSATSHIVSNTVNAVFIDAYGYIYAATSAGLSISYDGGSS